MAKRLTNEEYIQKVEKINPNIKVVGRYIDSHTKILHKCKIDDCEWYAQPNNILNGKGCPKCGTNNGIKKRAKTHNDYIIEISKINSNIEVIGKYINNHTSILHKCKVDGYEWMAKPSDILRGKGCPKCAGVIHKTHGQYIVELSKINNNIEVIGKYVNAKTPILHKCKLCGHEWNVAPSNVIFGKNGCPVCAKKTIGNPPEYKNSIWASEYREYFAKYMVEEQMKMYMPYSSKKIEVICTDCGKRKLMQIYKLLMTGLSCACGDGNSYPNKFVYSVLNQLNIDYIPEYSPDWIGRKRYDMYIPSINCIIENHGMQHYIGGFEFVGGKTLEEEQKNDEYKERMAKENGIQYYIILDCRVSTVEWIKNSIMKSELCKLLDINNNIDWKKCDEFANTNFVKKCAELWNENYLIKDISVSLHISKSTIRTYLSKASNIGMCNYSPKESRIRSGKAQSGSQNYRARKVVRICDNKIYGCLKEAASDNHLSTVTMTKRCKFHNDFMYYDDWIKLKDHVI